VCHPATHLCMLSAAAAQRPSGSCSVNSECDSGLCDSASHQCTASFSTAASSERATRSLRAISTVR
jgi:hypothetical protein